MPEPSTAALAVAAVTAAAGGDTAGAVRAILDHLVAHPEIVAASWEPGDEVGLPALAVPAPIDPPGARRGVRPAPSVDVADGDMQLGVLRVMTAGRRRPPGLDGRLAGAAASLALAAREVDLARQEDRLGRSVTADRRHLAELGPALAAVRADERRRLVRGILDATREPVARLLRAVAELRHAVATGTRPDRALGTLRQVTDQLSQQLRRVARGTDTVVLRAHGPAAALQDCAQDLRRPLRIGGDLGLRAGWEIESGLFWAVVAVLRLLDGQPGEGPLHVVWSRGRSGLTAGVRAEDLPPRRLADLAPGLAPEQRRLAVLGGGLNVETTGVVVWLPDGFAARSISPWAGGPQ